LNFQQENKSFRQISVVNEEPYALDSPLPQSNYALDIRQPKNENISKKSIEQNIKGFVDGCVRSSLHDISCVNREADSKFFFHISIFYISN
jgi:hypothetical protein